MMRSTPFMWRLFWSRAWGKRRRFRKSRRFEIVRRFGFNMRKQWPEWYDLEYRDDDR